MTNDYCRQMAISRIYGWHIYVLSMPGYSKIGTATRVWFRIEGLQNGNPHRLELEAVWHFRCRNEARAVEAAALNEIGLNRLPKRDWCRCSPHLAIAAVEYIIGVRNSDVRRLGAEEAVSA